MLTAEPTLPSVQPTSSAYSCSNDSQNSSVPLASAVVPSQHPASPLYRPTSHACTSSDASQTPAAAASPFGHAASSVLRDCITLPGNGVANHLDGSPLSITTDSHQRMASSFSDFQRHTIDGALPMPSKLNRHASEDNLHRHKSSASVILPTRQQQQAAICRLRKPLAVVTQKNSLIRYTRDGRRYWRWKDVVARVLHICRGASADDYSLLLQTEHWLEACDSKHRYGSNLKPYFKVWLESDTQQSFFKWLDEGQGLHVDIEDRPRSKLDADRVVYCGIERCFFEVTVVQGVFRYRISKRHVTTDSSRDQPPCPPNLGETMDSIRNSMLPQRMHSPPILGSQTVHCGIPASPSTPAPKRPAQLSEEARNISVRQEGVARESAVSEPVPAVHLSEIDLAAGPCIVQSRDSNQTLETHVQYESDACSAHGVDHPRQRDVLQSGRLSVDANNAGCRKRPGLLTQEFNRAAGMPYSQGGDSIRGHDHRLSHDEVRVTSQACDVSFAMSAFSSSPPPAASADRQVSPQECDARPQLPASKSGSVLADQDASLSQCDNCGDTQQPYPYHVDDRYAGGWLSNTGQICMRQHGVNSMPSGLVHFPSLVFPSSRMCSHDVEGSDEESSASPAYANTLSERAAGSSSGSSPEDTSAHLVLGCVHRKSATPRAAMPYKSIHGFPSMPRLGVTSYTQPPMLRPSLRTLRFPVQSTTPDAADRASATNSKLDAGASQQSLRSPLQNSGSRDAITGLTRLDEQEVVPELARSKTQLVNGSTERTHMPSRGWEILRQSLRMRKLPVQASPHPDSTTSSSVRAHSQRRMHGPLDRRVADVANPRLVSNSAIPENLKLLDIVETVAGPRQPPRSHAHVCEVNSGTVSGICSDHDVAGPPKADEVRDLADVLEERMVSTGQLVKVKTQAQLEQMLPCAPKVLSKDECGGPSGISQLLKPVHENGCECDSDENHRPKEPVKRKHWQPDPQLRQPEDVRPSAHHASKETDCAEATESVLQCDPRTAVHHPKLGAFQDATAMLEKVREKWIYVWDMHSRLYINRKMPGRFHHSSFVAGGAVKAAGSIVVENGVLKQLTTWSGHYRPRASDIALFLQWLESNHVDMKNVELLLVKPNKPNSKMNRAA